MLANSILDLLVQQCDTSDDSKGYRVGAPRHSIGLVDFLAQKNVVVPDWEHHLRLIDAQIIRLLLTLGL